MDSKMLAKEILTKYGNTLQDKLNYYSEISKKSGKWYHLTNIVEYEFLLAKLNTFSNPYHMLMYLKTQCGKLSHTAELMVINTVDNIEGERNAYYDRLVALYTQEYVNLKRMLDDIMEDCKND